ncbi:hypothetical protein H8959_014441 [Pygathrix nigripes]
MDKRLENFFLKSRTNVAHHLTPRWHEHLTWVTGLPRDRLRVSPRSFYKLGGHLIVPHPNLLAGDLHRLTAAALGVGRTDRDEHRTPSAHVGAPAAGAGKPRPGQSREAAPQPRALAGLFSWPFLLSSAFRGHPSLHSSASAADPPPPGDPAIVISSSYHGFFAATVPSPSPSRGAGVRDRTGWPP